MRTVWSPPDGVDPALVAGLGRLARAAAGGTGGHGEPVALSRRPDGVVVRVGEVVAKAHPEETDEDALRRRLDAAASPELAAVILAPLPVPAARPGTRLARVAGRLATVWPAGTPVDPDRPDAAPWEPAAELLARLHAIPAAAVGGLPAAGGPSRVARAVARLRAAAGQPAAATVLRAYATLPAWLQEGRPAPGGALVHGDWHLGQMVRHDGRWRLIDTDDLGAGDAVWDLARPAAWFAAGLLPPEPWERFLAAYRAAGGRAVPPAGDPWARLELPARALTVQTAALAVAAAARAGGGTGRALDDDEIALVGTCARIVALWPVLS